MRRGDFNRAGAELLIDVFVRDNGDFFVYKGKNKGLSYKLFVAFIRRVYGYRGIAEHCFRTGGRNYKIAASVLERVAKMPEEGILFGVFDFRIRKGGLTAWAPVDYLAALIDKPFFVEIYENFAYGSGAFFVHRESEPVPIAGGTELLNLFYYAVAVLFFPSPGAFEETLSAEVLFLNAFLSHLLDNFNFGCDGRVVGTGKPQRFVALHTLIADDAVLKRLIERVTHM